MGTVSWNSTCEQCVMECQISPFGDMAARTLRKAVPVRVVLVIVADVPLRVRLDQNLPPKLLDDNCFISNHINTSANA
jgi:hypothetical protein